jgi:hypothetical protein
MDDSIFAVAIHDGAKIGFSRHFVEGNSHIPILAEASATTFASTVKWRGPWANGGRGVKNRYLGVKFTSLGKVHFGWARITITIPDPNRKVFKVLLSGYAYDTIPGKAIIAGQTKSTDDNAEQPDAVLSTPTPDAPQLPMLGALALGVPGLSIWRREDSVAATSDRN